MRHSDTIRIEGGKPQHACFILIHAGNYGLLFCPTDSSCLCIPPPFVVNNAGGVDEQVGKAKEFSLAVSVAKNSPDIIKFISYS